MTTAYIAWLDRGEFALHTPYDADFVRRLKELVRPKARRWEPEARRWVFDCAAYSLVAGLCHESFNEVLVEPKPEAPRPLPASPYRTLGLVDDAPPSLVAAAYRALAKLYHPDAAGYESTARMQRINAAYEQITRGTARR